MNIKNTVELLNKNFRGISAVSVGSLRNSPGNYALT